MTKMMLVPILLFLTGAAFADEALNPMIGKYSNPKYNRNHDKAEVQIYATENGEFEMAFNVPCADKPFPMKLRLDGGSQPSGKLTKLSAGGGQCYLDKYAHFRIDDLNKSIRIYTIPKILVPGFDGFYDLFKE